MSHKLNASIADIPLPTRMRHLPVSDTGYPIPWFVADVGGVRDFRVADQKKYARAMRNNLCWLCGDTLGRFKVFTAGPMCAVNRTSAEPPSHRDCAEYAVKACPFLTKPRMRRNDVGMPGDKVDPPGVMLLRNPGCVLLWITKDYQLIRTPNGPLIRMGEPVEIIAYAEGRRATRGEVDASIASGLPLLTDAAESEGDEAMRDLTIAIEQTRALFASHLYSLDDGEL